MGGLFLFYCFNFKSLFSDVSFLYMKTFKNFLLLIALKIMVTCLLLGFNYTIYIILHQCNIWKDFQEKDNLCWVDIPVLTYSDQISRWRRKIRILCTTERQRNLNLRVHVISKILSCLATNNIPSVFSHTRGIHSFDGILENNFSKTGSIWYDWKTTVWSISNLEGKKSNPQWNTTSHISEWQ